MSYTCKPIYLKTPGDDGTSASMIIYAAIYDAGGTPLSNSVTLTCAAQ